MITPRSQIIEYIEQGTIKKEQIGDALAALKVTPDAKSWLTFIDHFLVWLGTLALSFSILFFIAYNWNEIGTLAKFGLLEGLIIIAIIAYCKSESSSIIARVSLVAASILLGVLLALYGQTYQTGADTWQLFFNWAMLMLPWAFIGRFPAIWIIWVILVNLSIVLYHQTFMRLFWFGYGRSTDVLWALFIFNTTVLIIWELLAKKWHWLIEHWAIRLLVVGSGVPLTSLLMEFIFEISDVTGFTLFIWLVWLAALYAVYRKSRYDLFMLAGGCLSVIVISVSFLAKLMLKDDSAAVFLFLALVVIGMGGGTALWLKKIHKEMHHG